MKTAKAQILNPNQWIDQYYNYLFNYTVVRVNDEEIAKDLVQDTFFSALKATNDFRGKSSEKTWLIAILKRKIIDYYRKINSTKGKAEIRISFKDKRNNYAEWIEECVADYYFSGNAELEMINIELGSFIAKCVERLPEKQATIFKMKFIQGLDNFTICEQLGITQSNLCVCVHRAKNKIKNSMENNWFG